jgi:type III secretion protein V
VIASVVALGMGMIPGMPTLTFLALAGLLGGIGFILLRKAAAEARPEGGLPEMPGLKPTTSGQGAKNGNAPEEFAPTLPLLVDLAAHLRDSVQPQVLNDELLRIRRALYYDLGVPFPGIQLRFNDHLGPGTYTILLSEVPVAQGTLRSGFLLARERSDHLQALQIPHQTDASFLPGIPTVWVATQLKTQLDQAGITAMEAGQVLAHHLAFVLKRYAADFLGIQETKFLLSSMEAGFPDLVREVTRVLPIQKTAEILQRLVSEEISVRNLRAVLEALIEWGQKEKDSVLLTEYVRSSLKRHISHKFSSGENFLPAYLLAPGVEDLLRGAIRQTSAGSYLALDAANSKRVVEAIRHTVGDLSQQAHKPVLLTSMDIRRYLRKMIEQELYELPVLSYQELTQDVNIQPLARVEL